MRNITRCTERTQIGQKDAASDRGVDAGETTTSVKTRYRPSIDIPRSYFLLVGPVRKCCHSEQTVRWVCRSPTEGSMQFVVRAITRVAAISLVATMLACGSGGGAGGTFDNTGGSPPPGSSAPFERVSVALDAFCSATLSTPPSTAALARSGTDIPVINNNAACTDSLRTALGPVFDGLTAEQALAIFAVTYGGCESGYEIARVTRDSLVVHPWILRLDPTLGALNPGPCPASVAAGLEVLRVDGIAGTNAISVQYGTVNPNYPRDADVPNF